MGQCNETQNTPPVTERDIAAAVKISESSDVVVVNVALTATEGFDRVDLSLGAMQDALVVAVAEVCKHVVVVVRCPGAVEMPWITHPSVEAVLVQFLPGQESGNALASVLFGGVNPSAKLPVTFPNSLNETWLQSNEQYPVWSKKRKTDRKRGIL